MAKRKKQLNQKEINQIIKHFKKSPLLVTVFLLLVLIANFFNGQFNDAQKDKTDLSNVQTFAKAKNKLIKLYKDHPTINEFYCDCAFKFEERKSIIDLDSCGYQVRKNKERANRIEWEHVMPAYNFGNQLRCWQDGGRQNCSSTSQEFNIMEGDMHNLQPAIGEVNGDRSNYAYGQFTQRFTQYGRCEFSTDFKNRQVQPREAIKGTIARIYLYMESKYNIALSPKDTKLMHEWNRTHPPQKWECQRNKIIQKKQGNDNPFITEQCL